MLVISVLVIKNIFTGKARIKDCNFVQAIKQNEIFLNDDETKKIFDYFKVHKRFRKIETYCLLSTVVFSSAKMFLRFIELHFVMIAETDNFLQLDFKLVNKILSSSCLSITSEVEVFQAAD